VSRERLSPQQWARLEAELRIGRWCTGSPPISGGRTWAPRGARPVVRVRGAGGGRVSIAGVACYWPGGRPHLFYTLLVYRRRKGEPKGFTWADYRDLIIATHRALAAPLVWCWDYVARHIIPVLCPAVLCGRRRVVSGVAAGGRLGGAAAGHIMITVR
jgi:hypothetical protein